MNSTIRFGGARRCRRISSRQSIRGRNCLPKPITSRLRHILVVLFLAWVPVLASAQVGRIFVSAEAYAGAARIVYVGKIVELKQIEYGKPLTVREKSGKPYHLVFEVGETIRGEEVKRMELVLSLQTTVYLEYLRVHSVGIMLVGGPNRLDTFPRAELGIEEQGRRTTGEWYQFRVLDPVKVPESGAEAAIASRINTYYDSCRMFTHELGIAVGRDAILGRVRAFARQHTAVLPALTLVVPNDFGALCGGPDAYCGITLPVCPGTKATLIALQNDPGLIMRRIKSRHEDFDLSTLRSEIAKAMSKFPEEGGTGQPADRSGDEAPAEAHGQTKIDYPALTVEELAMRFRFPDRYMDCDRGDPAPRDMALGEMLRRKKLQRASTMADVEFLLGKPGIEEGDTAKLPEAGRVVWNYGMMGGGLGIIFDSTGRVSEILEHHDGDPESAHTDNLLDPGPDKAGQGVAPDPSLPPSRNSASPVRGAEE